MPVKLEQNIDKLLF